MPLKVTFPDGSEREVLSRTVTHHSREIPDQGPTFSVRPIPDHVWDYFPVIGGWRARLKRR